MAQYNENITLAAPNPLDRRYLSLRTSAGSQLPYSGLSEVYLRVPLTVRYSGLTVLVRTGTTNVEFWFKNGIQDSNLIEKKYDSTLPLTDYVTGGTNLGYFSGYTGVQTLPIDHLTTNAYDGNYRSLYNYYFRDSNGFIQIGTPSDGIPKRGYLREPTIISPVHKSWIWNEYIGSTLGGTQVGWILIDGDISSMVGTYQFGIVYYIFPYAHTETAYVAGTPYPSLSNVSINAVVGSLTTGSTIAVGSRPFAFQEHNNLHFRTIVSDTPTIISTWDDSTLIHISGASSTANAVNVGGSVNVYSGQTGTTFIFKTLVGSGDTIVSDHGNYVVIASTGGDSGTYNLDSPAVCQVGGINIGTVLTGKTAFQLFEEILVPVQYPTLTAPTVAISLSPSTTLYEIGCSISILAITGTFNAGSIAPQYIAVSSCRSNGVSSYCFIGTPITGIYPDSNVTKTINVPSYSILSGAQTWSVKACHLVGVQPFDSKGVAYSTPLSVGETVLDSATITGILPYYWGMSSTINPDAACIANCGCTSDGAKVLQNVTTDPFPITFNSNANDYIWFALPECAATKTCWCVNGTNNGTIGGVGNLFAAPYTCSINSAELCWSGCNYEIYVSCGKTGTAAGVPMYIS